VQVIPLNVDQQLIVRRAAAQSLLTQVLADA
jgi:hypothetical protein